MTEVTTANEVVMRGRGVLRVASALALITGLVAGSGAPAAGAPSVRAGWWSAVAPAPPPPDVPDDGLYASGGLQGPTAVAAVSFELPAGATATALTIELAGTSPQAGSLLACLVPADAASFEEAQNGAWADRPAYDCDAASSPAVVDGSSVSFDVTSLQQGSLLALALVPGTTDRTSFARPTIDALQLVLPEGPASMPAVSEAPPATATAASVAAPPARIVPAPVRIDVAPALASTPVAATPVLPAPVAAVAAVDGEDAPTRTRVGGAIGFALLLAVLLFYSQGRGLLGARVGGH